MFLSEYASYWGMGVTTDSDSLAKIFWNKSRPKLLSNHSHAMTPSKMTDYTSFLNILTNKHNKSLLYIYNLLKTWILVKQLSYHRRPTATLSTQRNNQLKRDLPPCFPQVLLAPTVYWASVLSTEGLLHTCENILTRNTELLLWSIQHFLSLGNERRTNTDLEKTIHKSSLLAILQRPDLNYYSELN